jgi:hypothetical protein
VTLAAFHRWRGAGPDSVEDFPIDIMGTRTEFSGRRGHLLVGHVGCVGRIPG